MTESVLRRELKKAIDRLPVDRLPSVADYIAFLDRPSLGRQIEQGERDLKAKKGRPWREIRNDV